MVDEAVAQDVPRTTVLERNAEPDYVAVVGCAENPKLPKINARVIRVQAGVGGIAMAHPNTHRMPAIVLKFRWKFRLIIGFPGIFRMEITLSNKGGSS